MKCKCGINASSTCIQHSCSQCCNDIQCRNHTTRKNHYQPSVCSCNSKLFHPKCFQHKCIDCCTSENCRIHMKIRIIEDTALFRILHTMLQHSLQNYNENNFDDWEIKINSINDIIEQKRFDIIETNYNIKFQKSIINNKQCSICYDEDKIIKTNCNHFVCLYCILKMFMSNNENCPLCREKINILYTDLL